MKALRFAQIGPPFDRYRGVFDGRRVLFLNPLDMQARNLQAGQIVDIYSHFEGKCARHPALRSSPMRLPAAAQPQTIR
jgi:anaerobic selenocysteine-containing dehydrogenase